MRVVDQEPRLPASTDKVKQTRRGRRPAAEVRDAVLRAAAELLFSEGLPRLTFERVAARAGASKVTLYKWWPSPAVLAFEAYTSAVEADLAPPDTGDMIEDLRVQLHAFVRLLMTPTGDGSTRGHVIAELAGAAQTDKALMQAFREMYTLPRREIGMDIFRRAEQRRELEPGKDLSILNDQLWGACYFRLIMFGEPLTTEYADSLVENLFGTTPPCGDLAT